MKKHLRIYFIVFCTFCINAVHAQTWKELTTSSSDLKTVYGGVYSVCSDSSGNVYAIGTFTNASHYTYVAKWNGTAWSELGSLGNGYNPINSICTDKDGYVYVGGEFQNSDHYNYVAKWDGTSWSEVGGFDGLKANSSIDKLISDDAGNLYATGAFTNANGEHYVAQWDGTSWFEVGGLQALDPVGELGAMTVDQNLNLYVGGNKQSSVNGVESIYKWDGSLWSEVGTSSSTNVFKADMQITSIGVTPTGDIYVATNNKNTDGKYIIAKWNGTTWSAIPVNITDPNTTPIVHVDYYGRIYVSGYEAATGHNGAFQFNIYKWNGTAFAQLGNLNGSSVVISMYTDKKGNLFAGGLFGDATTNIPFVAEYTSASGSTTTTAITSASYADGTIKIYPNPAQNVVTVDVTTDLIGTAYYIYDARGILHSSGTLNAGSSALSIENLSTGMYFIQLGDLSKNAFKLVKK